MTVSIFHRVSGDGLAIVGGLMFLWWLGALAAGPDAYAAFVACVWHDPDAGTLHQVTNILGKVVLVGLTWALFQHLFSGLRHLRSEEHTSELQSLMRTSYAVFCLKKKKNTKQAKHN